MNGYVEKTVLGEKVRIKVIYRKPKGDNEPYYQAIGLGKYNDLEYRGVKKNEAINGLKSKIEGRIRG